MQTKTPLARFLVLITGLLAVVFLISGARAAEPPVARSLEFDGNFSNTVVHPLEPWMNSGSAVLTVETWVHARRLENLQALVARAHATNLWFGLSANRLRFARSGGTYVESAGTIPLRRWTHVAATYDGTTARFYINGVLAGSQALLSAGNNCTNSLSFGGQRDVTSLPDIFAAGYAFDGYLDEVRLWTTARSGAQIAANMNLEVREGADLLAAFGNGGQFEELRRLGGGSIGANPLFRLRGFGLLPATLCIPWTSAGLTVDGTIDPLFEYDGAETIVLRSGTSPTAYDQPAYLIVSTNAVNNHLFIGVPDLPVGVGGATPVLQIRGSRDVSGGSDFALGDWECRFSESGLASGTMYRTDPFVPVPTWRTWARSANDWQAATASNGEFLQNHEFRIQAAHLDQFTNAVRLLARFYQYDTSGDQLVAPRDGVGANPATFATANWCDEVNLPRHPRAISGSVSNVTLNAGVPGLVVSMYSGDTELTGIWLANAITDAGGHFTVSHPGVPEDRKVTVTYAPPGGYVTYLDPLPETNGPMRVIATNSPYSVTYPHNATFLHEYLPVHFRLASSSPVTVGAVTPTSVPATVLLRLSPPQGTPTNTITLAGTHLHAGLRLYFKAASCVDIPPTPCLGTPSLVRANIVSVAPDGSSLVAQVPSGLAGNEDFTRTFQLVVEDPDWLVSGGSRWNNGPSLSLTAPAWPTVHGFEFANADDLPSPAEFEACYGDSIFTYLPVPPFRVRDPYYGLWGAVYLLWMDSVEGSCFGMAGTSRLVQDGTIPPALFDTAESGGVHAVRRGHGFPGLGPTGGLLAPKPANWSGFDFFQPYRPLNLWGRITSLAGAQTSGEELAAWLIQLRPPVPFGAGRGLAQGNPLDVLNRVRSQVEGFTLCLQQRDFGMGHCVTPYAVMDDMGLTPDGLTPTPAAGFSLIKVYDNNRPDRECFIEVHRSQNTYRYNPRDFPLADEERDGYLGRGLFTTPMSIYRHARHAPGPDFLAEFGVDFIRTLLVGASSASVTNAAGQRAGWTSAGLTNSYPDARIYLPVGHVPGASNHWDSTMYFLPRSNAPMGGTFTSHGSNVLAYAALGWSDIAFGFHAPDTGAVYSIHGLNISSNLALQGLGVRGGATVQSFSAMVSARDAGGSSRVWTLDAGAGEVTPDVHLSHEGFGLLRVRNSGAAPITYRVNLAGVDAGAGAFEFSSEWITQPAGVTLALRTLPGSPGFQREVDANNDGTPESIDALPARGALRAGRDGGLLALRWRPSATDETLENTADLTTPNWTPNGASVSNDGADRVANVATAGPAQFFRVKPAGTNCLSPAAFGTGLFPNPWETTAFKFEALTASGTMRPHNEILTRSGATGLDVFHTVRIHPQDDCRVLHIEVRQTSGSVRFEAVGALGGVIARAELVGPGTGLQRVTLRGARDRIHFVRVISPNALCLIVNVCAEREAQTVVQPSCLNFESLTPDFLNSPAPFGLFEITGHYGPLTIEPVPGLAVNGLLLPGNNSPHTSFRITPSFGTAQRVTIRLVCPDGGVSIQAYNSAGAVVGNSDGAGASPEPQTLSLAVAGMARFDIFVPNIASAHLLEICVERDPLP